MQRCLQLAIAGAGNVAPNPMVGAVLVYKDVIIGEGYHQQFGSAHAEVNCINSVSEENRPLIEKSTLYVSLEPCAHFGKTPPCADLIAAVKIPAVVIGCRDKYEEVDGKGIAQLQAAGVEVVVGILETEAIAINKRFFTFHRQQRPYIILKWAQSYDQKIARADFSRVHISNDVTNRRVHKWRSEEAAIMIGANTALHDNPALTTRLWKGSSPLRVVIDNKLKLSARSHLLSGEESTIVFNTIKNEEAGKVSYRKIDNSSNVLTQVLQALHQLKIGSVLVEGGGKLLQSFIDEQMWDEARVITNQQLIIGNGIPSPILNSHSLVATANSGSDKIDYYEPGFDKA